MTARDLLLCAACTVFSFGALPRAAAAAGPEVPLVAREVFFGNPDRASVQLSPDGKTLSFLAAKDGVLNVWVAPVSDPGAARAVTADTKRGIRQYFWAFDNAHILYSQDVGGDENWKIFSVDVATGQPKDLTPFETIPGPDGQPAKGPDGKVLRPAAQIEGVSPNFPGEIVLGINNRDPRFHDIYRVNIATGAMKQLFQNDGFAGLVVDDEFNVRLAMQMMPDGGSQLLKLSKDGQATPFQKIGMEDSLTTNPVGFDKAGGTVYMLDSRGRDTAALTAVRLDSGDSKLVAEDSRADIGGTLVHPTEKTVQAVNINYDRSEWKVLDPAVKGDFDYLKTVASGEIGVSSRTLDDSKWIVSYLMDDGPVRYYLYDRAAKNAKFLFTNRKPLEGLALSKMRPVVITSRDGLKLVSYLTLPAGGKDAKRPEKPLPMVLFVHGGPWARDSWGFNPYHQWLANRGYAVLSVNYRGSTGFGKNFVNAGNREWAGKMHDDLIDAVTWAVNEKIADPSKVAIMGGSYGGYATLVGLTFTPDTFACGVDIVGPSNIITLLNTIPPYWQPLIEQFAKRVGDHRTEEGRKFLESRSPLSLVDNIRKPLLIGQGANDPRVKQSEADQIAAAMQKKGIPVTYVLFPDEGHGFARPENSMAFNAVIEQFLASHLKGRAEPVGDAMSKSSAQVKAGGELIPGLDPSK